MNLYVTFYSVDHVTEVDLNTLTKVNELNIGNRFSVDAIIIDGYLYVALDADWPLAPTAQIVKIDLWTFSEVGRLVLPEANIGGGNAKYMAMSGNILYLAVDLPAGGVNGGIVRIDLTTFTRIDRLDLAVRNPQIKISGDHIYVTYWLDTQIDRIPISTFVIDATIHMANTDCQQMLIEGNHLYVSHSYAGQDRLTQISLVPFAEVASILLNPGEPWIWGLASDGTYVYCGLSTNPGIVVRVNISTFTRVDALTFGAGERDAWWLAIDGDTLWAVLENWPTTIIKIDIPTFTRVDSLDLDAGEGDSWASALGTPTAPFIINKAYALSREEL